VCASSLFFEEASRRGEIALYCMPRTLEIAFNKGVKERWWKPLPYGEILLFSLSMGVLMFFFENSPKSVHRSTFFLLSKYFGASPSPSPSPSHS